MQREKTVSVRFAAVGGETTKAEMRSIGQTGRDAMSEITGGTAPASAGFDTVNVAAQKARAQLEAIAMKASATAAALRATGVATTDMQERINRATGVTPMGGGSAAAILQHGQALDELRAKYNPVFAVIQRYRQQVSEIRAANLEQAISEDEKAAAISRARQAALADIAVIKNRTVATAGQTAATRASAIRMQQLSYQINDIGVSLASGMNPFVVMAQQGTQVAQIYGFGNGGVSGALRDVGRMMGGVLTKNPYVAAAIGVAAAAVAGLTYEINQAQGVTVGFGDTAKAVFQVVADGVATWIKPAVDAIAPWFQSAWEKVVLGVKWVGNTLINGMRIAIEGIGVALEAIPDMFEMAWQKAKANVFWALSDMVMGLHNFLADAAKGLNETFGTDFAAPTGLSELGTSMNKRGNDAYVAGDAAGSAAGDVFKAFGKRMQSIWNQDPLGDFFDAVMKQAVENAQTTDDPSGSGGKQKRQVMDLVDALKQELAVLRESDPVKKKMLGYADKLAGASFNQKKQVYDLVVELDRAKNGWEAIPRALEEYAESAKRIGKDVGDTIVAAFKGAEDAVATFVRTGKLSFKDMVTSMLADLARLATRKMILGPLAAGLGAVFGGTSSGGGGFWEAFTKALPNMDGGGWTGSDPRTGGLDGKGGFLAMMHPQERVIDTTKGGSGPMSIHVSVSGARGNAEIQQMVASGVTQGLAAYDQRLPGRVNGIVAKGDTRVR